MLNLELHAVQVGPSRCEAQEGPEWLCGAEKLVESTFGAGVVTGGWQHETDVFAAQRLPDALCQCQLCQFSRSHCSST